MISSDIAILKMNNMARFDPLLVLCSLQIVQNNHLDIGDILSLKNYTQVTAVLKSEEDSVSPIWIRTSLDQLSLN